MCAGKDCRKRCEYVKVRAELEPTCDVLDCGRGRVPPGPVVVVGPTSETPVVLGSSGRSDTARTYSGRCKTAR